MHRRVRLGGFSVPSTLMAEDDFLAGATPAGKVFVFNLSYEDMSVFGANGKNLGPIPGAAAAPYVPPHIVVPRVLNQSDNFGAFANKGTNTIVIQWMGDPIRLLIMISSPLFEDLLMYIFPFEYVLVNIAGEVKARGPISSDGLMA